MNKKYITQAVSPVWAYETGNQQEAMDGNSVGVYILGLVRSIQILFLIPEKSTQFLVNCA